jgi:signal transduction histidine kinase
MVERIAKQGKVLVAGSVAELEPLLYPLLESRGYDFLAARDEDSLLGAVLQGRVDLVLLDLESTRIEPLAVLRQIHQVARRLPVVLLTESAELCQVVEALATEGVSCLRKPFPSKELIRTIQAAVRLPMPGADLGEHCEQQTQKLATLGRLTSAVVHEFNNQMTVVMGYGDLLVKQFQDLHLQTENLMEIRRAAERATTLGRQLLDYSRARPPAAECHDLNVLVTGMANLLRRLMTANIQLETRLAAESAWVRADRDDLEQIILNLVLNARDAMPQGGLVVLSTAHRTPESDVRGGNGSPRPQVTLQVTDNGAGMDETTRTHLFRPFFTSKPAGQGTGLGLYIVRRMVERSGGRIEVSSTPGQGTTFAIHLPRVEAEAVAAPSAPLVAPSPVGSETVLLVEDSAEVRDTVCRILRRQGYKVLETRNASEALQTSTGSRDPVQLAITDVVLPEMTGPDLAQELRRVYPGLKLLYMSGYDAGQLRRQGILPPETPFLQKPFTSEALAVRVREVLG